MKNGIVANWMSSSVVTVTPKTCLSDARQIINSKNIRALPVTENGKLIGIVTRRGLLRADIPALDTHAWNSGIDLKDKKIGDVMTNNPITTRPNSLIPKAARVMLENKISALPVLDDSGNIIGILTSSDILRFIIAELPELKKACLVSDYMTNEVVTIEPDTSLLEAHRLMGTKRIRSLPVMKENELVGVVTRTDLMSSDPSRFISANNQELSLKILTQSVEQIMTRNPITVTSDQSILEAAQLMLVNKIHCLPVLNAQQQLEGIITESDLFLMVVQKFF